MSDKTLHGDHESSQQGVVTTLKLDDEWGLNVDNHFAANVFEVINKRKLDGLPDVRSEAQLCEVCSTLDISRAAFKVQLDVGRLQQTAPTCNLCRLVWKACEGEELSRSSSVTLARVGSWLWMGPTRSFSLCRTPELKTFADFQIGLPDLSIAGSAAHFEVVRQWLHECDTKHHHERSAPTDYSTDEETLLPTRLLDVGISDSADTIRLWETRPSDTGLYVALSHPWGAPPYFCTYTSNLDSHLSGISIADLPATFRHAVATTRALGIRYLWIDSICIVQGPDGDFGVEAKRMERVFRGAYCVLAASCALGQDSGFLKPRRERYYVPFRSKEGKGPFYVCENVDDFDTHALRGHLNSRGWVLQEHALARRTLFFTEHQTYWECGAGVQCETGTRMSNLRAAFLGDTHFPQMILSASKGEHIVRYQNLYAQYSRLGLSRPSDRLYAINGLQTRLLRAFRTTEGGFGLFDEGPVLRGHLRRSLLWRRGEDVERLESIGFPGTSESPPSWSWMAYTGGIDYLEPVFDKTSWKPLTSPWTRPGWADAPTKPLREGGGLTLEGVAERFDLTRARGPDEALLVFDRPEEANSPLLHCVVLGASSDDADGRSYVLVVKPMSEVEGNFATWARVGAGHLTARCLEGKQTRIVIC